MTALEQAILRTLVWFWMFERPLSMEELEQWMIQSPKEISGHEVQGALTTLLQAGKIVQEDMWFAPVGAKDIARVRRMRSTDALRKMRKLRTACRWLRWVPGVVGIAAANTLALDHTRTDSDIDLFIIVRPGALWSARWMSVLPFALLGMRPHTRAQDPFCFSFFATDTALDLRALQWPAGDPYLAMWVRTLVPVIGSNEVFEHVQQQNTWGEEWMPQTHGRVPHPCTPTMATRVQWPAWAEKIVAALQRARLAAPLQKRLNQDSAVVISDQYLKFHENDRREIYRDQWLKLCQIHQCAPNVNVG